MQRVCINISLSTGTLSRAGVNLVTKYQRVLLEFPLQFPLLHVNSDHLLYFLYRIYTNVRLSVREMRQSV